MGDMMPVPTAPLVVLTVEERKTHQRWAARPSSAQTSALRCWTVLAGAEKGLRERLDPGAPVEGNGYAQPLERTLARTWHEALERAERSAFLREALGAEFVQIFLAIKRQECERFSAEVSELDYAWYLRN